VYNSLNFSIFINLNGVNQGNTFVQYSNIVFAYHIFELWCQNLGFMEKLVDK
jgi:hypothetical protein